MKRHEDMQHVADLVRMCADTMRLISRSQRPPGTTCPFRHIACQLDDLSDEIKDVAADLNDDWRRNLA